MTDIQAIKKAAEAATQGPRHVERDTEVKVDDDGITLALCDTNTAGVKEPGKDWYEEAKADADLIALLDPATVLELCDGYRVWQPIETAPKDGSVILVWRFYPCAVKWTGDSEYPWEAIHLYGVSALNRNGFQRDDPSITHWMPLPEPPK